MCMPGGGKDDKNKFNRPLWYEEVKELMERKLVASFEKGLIPKEEREQLL